MPGLSVIVAVDTQSDGSRHQAGLGLAAEITPVTTIAAVASSLTAELK